MFWAPHLTRHVTDASKDASTYNLEPSALPVVAHDFTGGSMASPG